MVALYCLDPSVGVHCLCKPSYSAKVVVVHHCSKIYFEFETTKEKSYSSGSVKMNSVNVSLLENTLGNELYRSKGIDCSPMIWEYFFVTASGI